MEHKWTKEPLELVAIVPFLNPLQAHGDDFALYRWCGVPCGQLPLPRLSLFVSTVIFDMDARQDVQAAFLL